MIISLLTMISKKAILEAQSVILSSRCRSERRMNWVSNHFEWVNPSSH